MDNTCHWVGLSGSLRAGSYNTALLKSLMSMLPEGVSMEIVSIGNLPLYNGDNDLPTAAQRPEQVEMIRQQMLKADGFVIVSPEYNYSIPGVLKNAIDWASRGDDSPLLNKPVALMGATPSMWGTIRMQAAFLPVFQFLNMIQINKPEILIAAAHTKFDANGNFTDEVAKGMITKKLVALKAACLSLKK